MNNRILMLAGMLLSVSAASAQHYWGKTFLHPQQAGSLAHDIHAMHAGNHAAMNNEHKTRLGVTFFTEQSVNRGSIGRYFSPINNNTFSVGDRDNDETLDIDGSYLVHQEQNAPNTTLGGQVTLRPERIVYGLNLAMHKELDLGVKGMFVRLGVPVVNVEHKLNYSIANASSVNFADGVAQSVSLENFFNGTVNITENGTNSASNEQQGLQKNRFKQSQSRTGFGDITISLGKSLVHNDTKQCNVYVEASLPTSNKPEAKYLFEAQTGNNGHFGLAVGIDAQAEVWHNASYRIDVQGMGKFSYLFEATETRVLGLQNISNDINNNYTHYALGAPSATDVTTPFQPVANFLGESLKVRPGSKLEAGVHANLGYKAFSAGLGYHMSWVDAESVWRKNQGNETAVVVANGQAFGNVLADYFTINAANIMNDAARTPVQWSHTLQAQATYKPCVQSCNNMVLGLGSSYQFSPDNSSLEQWGVWLSAGWSF